VLADLLPALASVEYDAPQGMVKIDGATNHTHLWPRVAKVNAEGLYDIVYDPSVRVAPDPFMLEYRPEFAMSAVDPVSAL
jgi:branched-chain amino acid transport system substrate-binding protein